ncbi:MAG: phage DNA encapsidation protein [Methanobrevibacter sp.]|nr:phage DNA encapsidation protein [Methanobrevibacter sp.]
MDGRQEKNLEFYNLDKLLKYDCHYNLIIGERSNGKTYACLKKSLEIYKESGKQSAYLRRWKEDFRGKRGETLFDALLYNEEVIKIFEGEWTGIKYYSGKWYLTKYDKVLDKYIQDVKPFMYGFSLSDMEHDKSTSYPEIVLIIFDEFLTRGMYLNNEFVLFCNVLSTIIRHRDDVKIVMLGNTVNKYCPYFREMGLKRVGDMEEGKVDIYKYGNSGLRVAVERCGGNKKNGKPSDVYFTFDNPSLDMITNGAWEIDLYPHCPTEVSKNDIVYKFWMVFEDELLQGEIVEKDGSVFLFIHEKTTELKEEPGDLIFTEEYRMEPNYCRNLLKDSRPLVRKIKKMFDINKVFYQDNEVGEVVRNYLKWCMLRE